eukprot:COSAG04_NODE_14328_length_572_cov_0.938689_1_plen_30_part_00
MRKLVQWADVLCENFKPWTSISELRCMRT